MIPAVLVLGCGVTPDGRPDESFQDRLDMALHVIERFGVTLAIIAGRGVLPIAAKCEQCGQGLPPVAPNPAGKTEAEIGEQYLRKRKISDSVLVLKETISMETLGNYIFSTSAFLQPLRVSKVVTVTSPGHSNRCHHYANRLWANLRNPIEQIVVHGGQLSRKTEMEELARSDFPLDFIQSPMTGTLEGALDWVKERNPEKAKTYGTLAEADAQLQLQFGADLRTLVRMLNDGSELSRWIDRFMHPDELRRRREMYRQFVDGQDIAAGDCSTVFQSIAQLGLLIGSEFTESMSQLINHHVPIKFHRIFAGRWPPEAENPELRRGFMKMVVLAVDYVAEMQGRPVVEIRAGQGSDLRPVSITKDEMLQMKAKAENVLAAI
jgi:hypothetical protein